MSHNWASTENGRINSFRHWAEILQQDLRFALRSLCKSPGFTAIILATMALGIGVNTAVFSILDGALLKPLPFRDPDRLYMLFEKTAASERSSVSYPNFQDWQRSTHTFSSLAAFRRDNLVMTGAARPERLHASMISSSFLSTLGIEPLRGREFEVSEDQLGAGGVVLISEDFWRQRFGASPNPLGATLQLDGAAYTIVGVVPKTVEALKIALFSAGDVYVPIGQWRDPSIRDRKVTTGLCVIGRLAPGVSESLARSEMSHLAANLAATYPDANRGIDISIFPVHKVVTGGLELTLFVLLFTVALVLLIACTNVANLLLARSTARLREFATRAALGASARRILVQLLSESVLLGLIAGVTGLALGLGLTHFAVGLVPSDIPGTGSIGLNPRVCLFATAISLGSGLMFGLMPALKMTRLNVNKVLKEGARGSSSLRHHAQRTFVVIEVALTLALLVASGLMIRSLMNLWHAHPGFDPHNVLVFEITPSPDTAADAAKIRVLFHNLIDRIETVPGVEAASVLLDPLPLSGQADAVPVDVVGRPVQTNTKDKTFAIWYFVGSDYFRTMRIALKQGRNFQINEDEHYPQVAIIDEAFARSVFPNENPIGKRITIGYTGSSEIIGVAAHVNHYHLGGDPVTVPNRQMYFPYSQLVDKYLPLGIKGGATIVVRTRVDPRGVLSAIQDQAAQLDNGLALFDVQTMDESVATWLATRRFTMVLLSAFAALALVLSAIGIYGVISYVTLQRTHEIGIRISLGAQTRDILRLILLQGGKLALLGVVIGSLAAFSLTRVMSGLLYGVGVMDPLTLILSAILLLLISLSACLIPARRAARVDPLISLRIE